jgi:hypothetical protein
MESEKEREQGQGKDKEQDKNTGGEIEAERQIERVDPCREENTFYIEQPPLSSGILFHTMR